MNSHLRIIICLIFGCLCLNVGAQRIKKLKGEYTSPIHSNETLEEARKRVLNEAILTEMAQEFGILMTDGTIVHVKIKDGKSNIGFNRIAESVAQGELIRIIGEPEYIVSYPNNELWYTVKVTFEARERVIKHAEIEAKFYRKGPDDESDNIGVESSEFQSGDQLIMSFQSSASGYLAVYLVEGDKAFCLLPYQQDEDGKYPVEQGKRNILFWRKAKDLPQDLTKDMVDEYKMMTDRKENQNAIHVMFSTKEFAKALDQDVQTTESGVILPRSLSLDNFEKWLGKCRARDVQFQHKFDYITVKQK